MERLTELCDQESCKSLDLLLFNIINRRYCTKQLQEYRAGNIQASTVFTLVQLSGWDAMDVELQCAIQDHKL